MDRETKMVVSEKKTKAMIFNFTDNHQFTTRLQLKGQNVEIVDHMKILCTVINSNLSWNDNCQLIIKKVNACMRLMRRENAIDPHAYGGACSCVCFGKHFLITRTNELK